MNSLDSLMGLNAQGVPYGFPMAEDPMMQAAYEGNDAEMMGQLGMPPMENPYEMVGMEDPYGVDPSYALTEEMLGGPAPQMTQAETDALAAALGIKQASIADPLTDPMYAQQFDTMNRLGGW